MQKTSYLLLIICILFSAEVNSQNLKLKLLGENEFETKIIDSLNYSKTHIDYTSIKNEIDSLQKTLFRIGYI